MNDSNTEILKMYAATAANNLPDFQGDFQAVATYFGYQFTQRSRTKAEVEKFLFSEITKKLTNSTDEFKHSNFKKIRSQLIIDELVNSLNIHDVYTASEILWDASRQINILDIKNKRIWIKCCELALAKKALGYDPYNNRFTNTEDVNYANAIKFFKAMKVNICTIDSDIAENDTELQKIPNAIIFRAQQLGEKGIDYLNTDLCNFYSPRLERFIIQRNVKTYNTDREASIPYGYLLNICARYFSTKPQKRIKDENVWDDIKVISTNFLALYKLEPYTPYSQMYGMGNDFIKTIQHSILYDNIFLFKQLPLKHIHIFFNKLFTTKTELLHPLESEIGIELSDIKNLISHLTKQMLDSRNINLAFTDYWLKTSQQFVTPNKVDIFLKLFSRKAKNLNNKYSSPFDYTESEIDNFPLIKINPTTYKIFNIGILTIQLFERYVSIVRKYDESCDKKNRLNIDQVVGDNMESLLAEEFSSKGITFLKGEKYKITHPMRTYLKTSRELGECDFIVETNTTIFFLELKKKSLTRRSSSGHIEDILNDTALSFLSAQVQAGYHEAVLRRNGEISFHSGRKLKLENREVQRISVSLFDIHALQDQTTIDNILNSLVGTKITSQSSDADVTKKLNNLQKNIDEFTQQIQLDCMAHYLSQQGRPFHNIRYISIPQILTLLENSNCNEEFEKEINITRRVSDGSLNWYTQYHRLRGNKQASQLASHPNLNNAIIQM